MYLHAAPYVYILCFISYILLRKCFIGDGFLAGGAKRLLMGPAWVATSGARKFYENSDVRRRMIACVANFDLRETIFRPKMFAWHVRPGKNDPFLYLVLCSN